MAEQEFKGNSNREKMLSAAQPQPESKKIVTGEVIKRPKKISFLNSFIPDIGNRNFGEFVINEFVMPNLKAASASILHGIVNKIFGTGFGYGGGIYRNDIRTNVTPLGMGARYEDYQVYSSKRNVVNIPRRPNDIYDLDTYIIPTRGEAEEILDVMDEQIDIYGKCFVSVFFEALGITPEYTVNNYGWISLSDAKIIPNGTGWSIKFPRPKLLA